MECPREKCTFLDFGKTLHIKSVANHHHGNFITRIVKSFTKCDQESSDGCTGESIYFKVNVFGMCYSLRVTNLQYTHNTIYTCSNTLLQYSVRQYLIMVIMLRFEGGSVTGR